MDFFIVAAYEIPFFKESVMKKWPVFEKYKNLDSDEKRNRLLSYFDQRLKEDKKEFIEQAQLFQQEWDKINTDVMNLFEEVIETSWHLKEIKGRLTYNPICPRDINQYTFDIFYEQSLEEAINTVIHESLHYIWFKKWSEVFPHHDTKEFNPPNVIWKISEFVVMVILNKPEFSNILENKLGIKTYFDSYITKQNGHFNEGYDENKLQEELEKLYQNKHSMEEFMRKTYRLILENKIFTDN